MKNPILLSTLISSILFAVAPQNEIKSVRGILGAFDQIEHTKLQIRAGYINLDSSNEINTNAFSIGGHAHFNTKRWQGIKLGTSLYTVQDLGLQNDDPLRINSDFFDANKESFSLLAEAYIDAKWHKSKIKLGRQILDSPHADSDDIRMIPNYFNAYRIRNNNIEDLTLHAGLIEKMAGWENGIDSSKFIDISQVLGLTEDTDGVYFVAGVYEGIENLSLSLWHYYYDEIASIWYAEAGYNYALSETLSLGLGLQYDTSSQSAKELLGEQNSNTFGMSIELSFEELGLSTLLAYNYEDDESGASALSLGGGTLFTSMEDQTLDAMEASGSAWVLGLGYNFEKLGIDNLLFGVAYGVFEAKDSALYETSEIDAVVEYSISDKLSLSIAYASIDDKTQNNNDYNQLRIVSTYNFTSF